MTFIKKIFGYIKNVFFQRRHAIYVEKNVSHSVSMAYANDAEENGRFYFKNGILDKLPEYMVILSKMKKHDQQGYNLYSRVGAVVLPDKHKLEIDTIYPEDVPSFGAICIAGYEDKLDTIRPKMVYIRRLTNSPYNVERTNGTVVEITLFYHDKKDIGCVLTTFVSIHEDGSINALRERVLKTVTINHRSGRVKTGHKHGSRNSSTVPQICKLQHNEVMSEWLKDANDRGHKFDTVHDLMAHNTRAWIGFYNSTSKSGFRVAATSSNITAAFFIDMLRTPYFFSDREAKDVTNGGRRKNIFHYVRPHTRLGKTIKGHFRGLRSFSWNGYNIRISVPNIHHLDIACARFSSEIEGPDYLPSGNTISEEKMVDIISEHLKA